MRTVAVIILNFNRASDTIECVKSVLSTDFDQKRIILLDNGSEWSDSAILAATFGSSVDLVKSPTNLGVAKGWNLAVRYARSKHSPDFVFLLNNDATVEKSVIRELVDFAERLPNAGALGPIIDDARSSPCLDERRSEVGLCSAKVDYDLTGCAMLIRTQVFDSIGLFDEDYFVYGEETDLLERMRTTSWRPYFVPTHGHVLHKGGATASMQSGFEAYHRSRSCFVFAGKNLHGGRLIQYLITYLMRYLPSSLVADLKSEGSDRRIIQRVRGVLSGFKTFLAVKWKPQQSVP